MRLTFGNQLGLDLNDEMTAADENLDVAAGLLHLHPQFGFEGDS